MPEIDIAVVGAGLAGAATAWAAARRGRSVALFEQFGLGHNRGSSHGSARIFRRAYADPLYVHLTGRARELWTELEAESGRQLLQVTGGIDYGRAREPEKIARLLAAAGVDHELLPARAAGERWPGIAFDGPVLFHPQAGVIDADRAIAAFLDGAGDAVISENTPVVRLEPESKGVRIVTAEQTFRAGCVVVAAGGWVAGLLDGLIALPPLRVTQQDVFHFRYADSAAGWPTFVHDTGVTTYGLPGGRDGGPDGAQKIGEHGPGRVTTAENRDGTVDPMVRERMIAYVQRWFPGLVPEPINEKTCLYTWTPNEDFIIDRKGPIVVCSPCSGHGAKFAPLIGELAAGLATGDGDVPDRFRLPR
ncbi:MAG TPA: FAD-dependent oxidoreductase [Mycobacteriales bacterium]|nr:FAD-dependent oxidoreductase [Mycobacteriales bacterium]